MSEGSPNLRDATPHLVRKSADETDGEFVRFESTIHPGDGDADLPHEPWGLDNDFRHVHPNQTERWEVVSGRLRISVDGDERTLTAGDDAVLPEDVPHRHWNPTAEPIRVVWERRPAFDDEEWAESVYALAQAGETDEDGVPSPLQIAVWIDTYPNATAYPAVLPVSLQRFGASLLAPVGRRLGYDATYERGEVDNR